MEEKSRITWHAKWWGNVCVANSIDDIFDHIGANDA